MSFRICAHDFGTGTHCRLMLTTSSLGSSPFTKRYPSSSRICRISSMEVSFEVGRSHPMYWLSISPLFDRTPRGVSNRCVACWWMVAVIDMMVGRINGRRICACVWSRWVFPKSQLIRPAAVLLFIFCVSTFQSRMDEQIRCGMRQRLLPDVWRGHDGGAHLILLAWHPRPVRVPSTSVRGGRSRNRRYDA